MKTIARFAAVILFATCVFSSGSIAHSAPLTTLVSSQVTNGQDRSGNNDPTKSPIPTCIPGNGCTFPVGNNGK